MPVWSVAPVEREPSSQSGRVSSAVVTFDVDSLRGVTRSGRVYQLHGVPGVDRDAAYLWGCWASGEEEPTWPDVTAAILSALVTALQANEPIVLAESASEAGGDDT